MGQKFGQHFLVDQEILQQMQRSLADVKKLYGLQYCLEIGPGEGALTKRLKSVFEANHIIAFEADLTLEYKIKKFFPLEQVVWGDVLEQKIEILKPEIGNLKSEKMSHGAKSRCETSALGVKWSAIAQEESSINNQLTVASDHNSTSSLGQFGEITINQTSTGFDPIQTLIAGNLPYYITSPILRKFFEDGQFDVGRFLIQKEVADKIDTNAKKKSFLRRIMNYRYTVTTIIDVPPEAFAPPPRVDSAVITVVRHEMPRISSLVNIIQTLDLISPYSRKTLGKISKMLVKREIVLEIPEGLKTKRVEELSWDEMEEIVVLNK